MTQPAGRKRALVGLIASALLGLAVFAPAASAQVGDLTGTVDTTTSQVSEPLKETIKQTTEPVSTTGSTATDTVDKVGSTVDSTTGTDTYDKTKTTVKTTTDSTTDTVQKTAGDVGGTVEQTSGGLVSNPNLKVKSPLDDTNSTKKAGGATKTSSGKTSEGSAVTRRAEIAAAREARLNAHHRLDSLNASQGSRRPGPSVPASAMTPPSDSFMTNLAEAARAAAEKLAFPLGLALMVGAFLMVQGRIDRKDAKLALAPIDSEQDLLSFQ